MIWLRNLQQTKYNNKQSTNSDRYLEELLTGNVSEIPSSKLLINWVCVMKMDILWSKTMIIVNDTFFRLVSLRINHKQKLEGYVIFFILSVAFIDKQQESDDNVGSN